MFSMLCVAPLDMPGQPRLDASETLRRVMVRGWERRAIFMGAVDRADFLARLGTCRGCLA